MPLDVQPMRPTTRQVPDQSTDPTRLLTVDQAAERLGTPTRFVRRLIAQRRIRFCRIGRYVRITAGDLDDFIEAGRVEPAAAVGVYTDLGVQPRADRQSEPTGATPANES